MTPAVIARRARVEGRVQGVYFRASAAAEARRLGLSGHARNLADGSVEVLAVGPSAAVAALLDWLWRGPPLARVTAVTVTDLDAATVAGLEDFRAT
jgi:acylphosphatase